MPKYKLVYKKNKNKLKKSQKVNGRSVKESSRV